MLFLNGLFVAGLALGLLPVIVHFLARRRRRIVPWGAMQFLTGTPPRFRRFYLRLSDLLILLLRVLAVCALALAFARPLAPLGAFVQRRPEVVLIVDASLSTLRRLADGSTAWDQEITAAERELRSLSPAATARIFLATDAPHWLTPAPLAVTSENRAALMALLRRLKPTLGGSDLPLAIGEALQFPPSPDRGSRRIVILSDATELPWHAADSERWKNIRHALRDAALPTSLVVAPAAPPPDPATLRNLSVDHLTVDRDTVPVGDEVLLTAEIKNHSLRRSAATEIAWRLDDREVGRSPLPTLERNASTTLEFPVATGGAGSHVISCTIAAADDLPEDNQAFAVIRTLDQLPLLIVDGGRQPGAESLHETGFLLAALGHLPGITEDTGKAPAVFQPLVIGVQELDALDLQPFYVVLLANVPKLSVAQAGKLAAYTSAGGGLWMALGDRFDAPAFNAQLSPSGVGLSPLKLASAVGDLAASTPGWRVLPPDDPHPATLLLRDTTALDITKARVQRHITPADPIPGNLTVLLALENQAPLVIAHTFGRGRVLIQTAPLNRSWSNLPILQAFVPMVREFVWYLAGGRLSRRNVAAGDSLVMLADGPPSRPFTVHLPGGDQGQGLAEKSVMRYANTYLPGLYQLQTGGQQPPETFSVRRSPDESDLTPLPPNAAASLAFHGVSFGQSGSEAAEASRNVAAKESMTAALLWLALALIVLESLLCWLLATMRGSRSAPLRVEPGTAPIP